MKERPIKTEKDVIEQSLEELNFQGVLEKLKTYAYSDLGIEEILRSYPTENIFWLRKEHELIEETRIILIEDDPLPFEGLTDVRSNIRKSLVENAVLNATNLLEVQEAIRVSRLMKKYFVERSEEYPNLYEETQGLHHNLLLEKHISDAINDEGEVKDTATKELARIRRSIFDKSNRLRNRLEKILRKTVEEKIVMEDFVTMREGRFVLPVKAENKRQIPGIIHGVSQTGATVFLEPSEIIEMNNELSLLINEEKREIYRILSNLTRELGDEAREFLSSIAILGHLDSITAKAKYALEFNALKPEILEENKLEMRNIRHPILVHAKGRDKVVPLSINFSNDKRGHLISGPNAGGKTVALKSIGLNIAMALSGIFPFGECSTNFRTIFTAIDDHQSIENDLSTFSSQLLQMKDILSNCSPESLVLIDEIGSGTDPQEGAALSAGILDSLIEMNVFFIASTHQSSLKTYALNRDVIENASLEFDNEQLKPTYKFLQGVPGNSYAFDLARDLGLSELILERAKKYLGTREKELEESISILQKYRNDAEKLLFEREQSLRKAEKEKEKYARKYSEIKEKRQEHIEKAKDEARALIEKANALIENTIREVREEKRSFGDIKKEYLQEKAELEKKTQKFPEKKEEPEKEPEYKSGDYVTMEDGGSVGTIVTADNKDKMAVVEFNGLKFRLPFTQLRPAKAPKEKKKSALSDQIKFDTKSKLDLRGMRAEAALQELDIFLSEAIMNDNLDRVSIVHGKGTGALREAVQDYLKNHHGIKSYRLGELVEGGSGVTIVEL